MPSKKKVCPLLFPMAMNQGRIMAEHGTMISAEELESLGTCQKEQCAVWNDEEDQCGLINPGCM